jgi:hypothetical protein
MVLMINANVVKVYTNNDFSVTRTSWNMYCLILVVRSVVQKIWVRIPPRVYVRFF